MNVADWLVISATLTGPIIAVQVQKWIELSREKRSQKLWIFHTLMATRAARASSNEHVRALNSIELFFSGPQARDKEVRDAWEIYLDFLRQPAPKDVTPQQDAEYNERGIDLLIALLEKMGKSLGYSFNKVQLRRNGYYPQGQADETNARASINKGLVQLLSGKQALPMSVTSFPVSEEALQKQSAVQDAILNTLLGRTPLKIDSSQPNSSHRERSAEK